VIKDFRKAVFRDKSPYDGIDPKDYPDDVKGWGSRDQTLETVIDIVKPKLILEIGSWKGASAIFMGECTKKRNLDTEIVAVDPHVGSAGLWLFNQDAMHVTQAQECGTYNLLLSNVVRAGLQDTITPFRATSSVATSIMKHKGLQPDLVYIDGSHEVDDVQADINHVMRVAHNDTVIVCDDYDHPRIQGVSHAVANFLDMNRDFRVATSPRTPVQLYTEKIVGEETGRKAVLHHKDNKFSMALGRL
jgi:predicted O-methyltransferase YrrM